MIPMVKITGSMVDSLFVYIAILGILIVIGTIIRLKVPILKKYHIPASLIAGVIGLILGPYFFNIIPKEITSCWSVLSGRLIVIIFAPMLMGASHLKDKKMVKTAMGATCYSYACCALQYGIPLLLDLVLLIPLFHVSPLFASIGEEGWMGGHGTAGGMALVFEELNWADGQSLSITSATIGLFFGIISGMIIINLGARKGWTTFIHNETSLQGAKEEMYKPDDRPDAAKATIKNDVLDTFAFHFSLICIAMFIGWLMTKALKVNFGISVSWFVTTMFGGLIVRQVLNKTSWKDSLDPATFSRIEGVCLEFLVAGAVSSVNVSVVVSYALPLLIQQGALMLLMLFFGLIYCRHLFPDYWLENSLLSYGTFCGVFATGMLLLKTCDPDLKSNAMQIYALRTPFTQWAVGGGIITGMMPYWIAQYGTATMCAICLGVGVIALIIPRLIGCWYPVTDKAIANHGN